MSCPREGRSHQLLAGFAAIDDNELHPYERDLIATSRRVARRGTTDSGTAATGGYYSADKSRKGRAGVDAHERNLVALQNRRASSAQRLVSTGVKLRGPERSEGHVSFNIRVVRRSSSAGHHLPQHIHLDIAPRF